MPHAPNPMSDAPPSPASRRFAQFGLLLGGSALGIGAALLLATAFLGDLRVALVRALPDGVIFTQGMGDLLFWQYEDVRPPEDPNTILSAHRLVWDADGFRVPAFPADEYAVVALGDSYTEGANVARPWPDALAQASGLGVRNLGFRGYGPQHYAWVMENYGVQYAPDVVLTTFFSGNDLASAGLEGYDEPIMLPAAQRAAEAAQTPEPVPQAADHVYRYPVYTQEGRPIVLLDEYISWLNIDAATLRQSVNYEVIADSLRRIREAAPEACLLLAYFPSKAEVYLPYVRPADRASVLSAVQHLLLDSDGRLLPITLPDTPVRYAPLLEQRRTTAQVLGQLAEAHDVHFVDLWPLLDAAAANGETLYYTYDTHWNQAGQQRVGAYLAQAIDASCPDEATGGNLPATARP